MKAVRHAVQRWSEAIGSSHVILTIAVLSGALAAALLFHVAFRTTGLTPPSEGLVAPAELVTVRKTTLVTEDAASAPLAKGPAAATPSSEASLARALQSGLRRAKCYDGPISGTWSRQARGAMARFVEQVNAKLPVAQPDPVLLALLEANPAASCLAAPPPAPAPAPTTPAPTTEVKAKPLSTSRAEVSTAHALPPAPPPVHTPMTSGSLSSSAEPVVPPIVPGTLAAAAVTAAAVAPRVPPRLAPYPLGAPPAAGDEPKPDRARHAPRSRVVHVYPRRVRYRVVQRRPSRTAFGSVSRSMTRNFNALKRALSLYSNY